MLVAAADTFRAGAVAQLEMWAERIGADFLRGQQGGDPAAVAFDAIEAAEAGASYVAFGAFYPTQSKTPRARATPDLLTWWSELVEVPCVAIGGITPENCAPLIEAGADFLAVASGVWDHPDGPAGAVRAFEAAIATALAATLDDPWGAEAS